MTTEDLLILRFCTVDDWVREHPIPWRPGPTPRCSDRAVITWMLARESLGYDSERRFRRLLLADWRHLFPQIPAQSALNRRSRWLGAAAALPRQHRLADIPAVAGDWLAIDTTPLPVKHPSRVRHADTWVGPEGSHAGYGRCAVKALCFSGFRLAVLTPLLTPPTRAERRTMPAAVCRFIAAHRNRIEGCFTHAKDQFHLEQHRVHTFWGLVTRISTKFAALTLAHRWRQAGLDLT